MSDHERHVCAQTSAQPSVGENGNTTPPCERPPVPGRVGRVVVLVLLGLILTYQLLIPPVVGQGDQGDFGRLFQRFGIQSDISDYNRRYFGYFIRTWKIEENTASGTGFLSPDVLLVAASLSLNSLLSKTGLYDIRCLALVRMALFLAAAALILQLAWRRGLLVRCVAVFALVVVFADVGYVAYFNSAYSEPSSFLFGLLAIAFYLRLAASRGISGPTWPASSPVDPACLEQTTEYPRRVCPRVCRAPARTGSSDPALESRNSPRGHRSGGLLGPLPRYSAPNWYREHIRYIAVFTRILPSSPDPRKDLQELGLDPSLVTLAGTYPWDRESTDRKEQLRQLFYPRISDGAVCASTCATPNASGGFCGSPVRGALASDRTGKLRGIHWVQALYLRSVVLPSGAISSAVMDPHVAWFAAWLAGAFCLASVFWLRARTPVAVSHARELPSLPWLRSHSTLRSSSSRGPMAYRNRCSCSRSSLTAAWWHAGSRRRPSRWPPEALARAGGFHPSTKAPGRDPLASN